MLSNYKPQCYILRHEKDYICLVSCRGLSFHASMKERLGTPSPTGIEYRCIAISFRVFM